MDVIVSHVVGRCEGYRPGTVFRLADGTAWVQVDNRDEYVLRDGPRARVWRNSTGACLLDQEGTSGVVLVERHSGNRWAGPGAFRGRHAAKAGVCESYPPQAPTATWSGDAILTV